MLSRIAYLHGLRLSLIVAWPEYAKLYRWLVCSIVTKKSGGGMKWSRLRCAFVIPYHALSHREYPQQFVRPEKNHSWLAVVFSIS